MATIDPTRLSESAKIVDAAPFALRAGDLDADRLTVVSFTGRERLSHPYRFDVTGAASGVEPAELEREILDRQACLSLLDRSTPRAIHGVVSKVSVLGVDADDRLRFRLRLVPRLRILRHRKRSRIFQDKAIPAIVDLVLQEHSIERTWTLRDQYPTHDYCVQYAESDLDFLHRLLAEAGISYGFHHDGLDGDHETILFFDRAEEIPKIPGGSVLAFRPIADLGGALKHAEHHVHRFTTSKRVAASSIELRDYDFRKPGHARSSNATSGSVSSPNETRGGVEVYEHPGEYDQPVVHGESAALQLEQLRRRTATASGASACARLLPGYRFELTDHEGSDAPEYVVTRIEHEGRSPPAAAGRRIYENQFECAPASLPVRPARHERPVRQVVETAVVVGPRGQDIHTDEHGRIKVQFHWDREGGHDEHSSCWIRVIQPWAGPTWGFQFVPRVGMEVAVAFLSGDPDRPLVLGSVNNALTPVTHPLPASQTRSGIRTQSTPGGAGYNELSFEDRAGEEQIALTAQRNLDETIRFDRITSIGHDHRESVIGDHFASVGGKQLETVSGNRSHAVHGDEAELVGGSRSERIQGDRHATVGGMSLETASEVVRIVDSEYRIHAGRTLRVFTGHEPGQGSIELQTTGDQLVGAGGMTRIVAQEGIELVCGESIIRITQDAIDLRAKKVQIDAEKSASVRAGGIALSGSTEIGGKTVHIASSGASLVLDGDAHLDGGLVKLNCGGAGAGGAGDPLPPEQSKKLSLKLLDGLFEPYENKKARVLAGGKTFMTTTGGGGLLELDIPKETESCSVTVWTDDYPDGPRRTWLVDLGVLAPADQVRGAQQRLRNLGYYQGGLSDEADSATESALREFQDDNRLSATGQLDAPTVAMLKTVHGY